MTDDYFTKMKAWRATFDLVTDFSRDTWVDYCWSTTEPTIKTFEHWWQVINPDYKIENFSCVMVENAKEEELRSHIIRIQDKKGE